MDVIIAGGGPSGLAAASVIHSAGLDVCILSRKNTDHGLILESVSPAVEKLLLHINALEALKHASRAVYDGIISGGHFSPLNPGKGESWYGHHIAKNEFIYCLHSKIRAMNIPLEDNCRISEISFSGGHTILKLDNGKELSARYIIDASGRTRLLGKMLGFSEHYYSPELAVWSGIAGGLNETLLRRIGTRFTPHQNGWTWYAPMPPGECGWTKLSLLEDCDMQPPNELKDYPKSTAIRRINTRWRVHRPLFNSNVILAGDAAGIIDPGSGLGVVNAMLSGIMAADAIVKASKNKHQVHAIFQEYDNWYMDFYLGQVHQLYTHYKNLGVVF